MIKVCLVTEELAGLGISGGIGGAFAEMADCLSKNGMQVDVIYCPTIGLSLEDANRAKLEAGYKGINLQILDCGEFVHAPYTSEKRSYAVYRLLQKTDGKHDIIHFHDYKGLGFFSTAAKKQGLAFNFTKLVIQLHGPTGWVLSANAALPVHSEQLKIDYIERKSIENADEVVSPSQYLIDWMRKAGYRLPTDERVRVLKNICTSLVHRLSQISKSLNDDSSDDGDVIDEIVLFARHEERKGFVTFCDALDSISDLLEEEGIRVTFLGKFGSIGGQTSAVVLAQRAKNWNFPITVRPNLDRDGAARYLAERPSAIVVIPSPEENSPYTVLEAISLKKRTITSIHGGASELIAEEQHPDLLCLMDPAELARKIADAVKKGIQYPKLAEALGETEAKWLMFHQQLASAARATRNDMLAPSQGSSMQPSVVLGITHYERPEKLVDAVVSVIRQTYRNLTIVVVDDGSRKPGTMEALDKIEVMLSRCGGTLLRKENGYLGAARNAVANATDSDYLCFLDDDDIAFPNMVEKLVASAVASGADVVNCLNAYMSESRRSEAWPDPSKFREKVSYVPTGGPLALAPIENCFGAATALIKRTAYKDVGGYTELKGIGYEDYELFVKLVQMGAQIEVCPEVLYLYEVDRPSMITSTSDIRNTKRVVDAIDFTKNEQSWRDLSSLRAGQVALERASARREWMRRKLERGDLLGGVDDPATGLDQCLAQLANYAAAIGSKLMESAFSEARSSMLAESKMEGSRSWVSPIVPRAGRKVRPTASLRGSVDLKIDLASGRYQQVVNQVASLLEQGEQLTDSEWQVMRQLLMSDMGRLDFSKLLPLLMRVDISGSQRDDAYHVLLHVARAMDDANVVCSVLEAAVDLDSLEYLSRYHDVTKAVRDGSIDSALIHYKRWGYKEGRKGFDLSTKLVAIIDKSGAAWDIPDLIARTKRESVVLGNGVPNDQSSFIV